jgi:hypothetical protein
MSNRSNYNQPFSGTAFVETTDGTKSLVAAPGVRKRLYLTRLTITITTSAAQSLDVESNDAAVLAMRTPISPAAGAQFHAGWDHGLELPENQALVVNASAPGIAAVISFEGYTKGNF